MSDAEFRLEEAPDFSIGEEIPASDQTAAPDGEECDAPGSDPNEVEAEKLFYREIERVVLLSRAEEGALAQRLVRARARVHQVLHRASQVIEPADPPPRGLGASAGQDFRERQAVAVLEHARLALAKSDPTNTITSHRGEIETLVTDLADALAEYRILRDQLVQGNLRLVAIFARRYHRSGLTFLDFIQEGTLGLIRAIEKYDPSRNVKFSTYAIYWIWQQIARAADLQGPLIRTPVQWNQFRRRMARTIEQLTDGSQRPPSAEDWAAEEGIEPERARAMALSFQFLSTDAPLSDDDDRPMESLLTSAEIEPEQQVLQTDLRQRLNDLLGQLPAREAEIMRLRFGLCESNSETLEEVGARLGVSRERVRQIESRALKRLRELCCAQGLQDYLA